MPLYFIYLHFKQGADEADLRDILRPWGPQFWLADSYKVIDDDLRESKDVLLIYM